MNVHYRGHGIRIKIFPAGVHHVTQHARSLWPDTPFWGQCPPSEDQHVTALPRLSREVPAGLHPKHSGVWAHRPLHSGSLRAGRYRPPPLGRRPGRAAILNWTSDKASADTATSRPITILAWWLVRKGQRPTQNKYPNLLVHWGLAETSRDSP